MFKYRYCNMPLLFYKKKKKKDNTIKQLNRQINPENLLFKFWLGKF